MGQHDEMDKMVSRIKRNGGEVRIVVFALFVVFAFGAWAFWASHSLGASKWAGNFDPNATAVNPQLASAGAWGDSFGGFNALFGALGFTAVVSTLYLQYQSLEQQRVDLHVQRFETTFFELLKLMRELRSELEYTQSAEMQREKNKGIVRSEKQTGFDAIKFSFLEVRHFATKNRLAGIELDRKSMSDVYMQRVHRRFESKFAPYFRIIYTIMYRISIDEILTQDQKFYYANILRSQFTAHETCLIAINAMSPVAKDLFEHVTYFRMLKYAPESAKKWLALIYPDAAFASRS